MMLEANYLFTLVTIKVADAIKCVQGTNQYKYTQVSYCILQVGVLDIREGDS